MKKIAIVIHVGLLLGLALPAQARETAKSYRAPQLRSASSSVLRLVRPSTLRAGVKLFGCTNSNNQPNRTGVIYYGGGNYAVTYSNGAVGSMQGTSPSSPAPSGAVQTDTHNAGSSGSGGFNTPGHLVPTGG